MHGGLPGAQHAAGAAEPALSRPATPPSPASSATASCIVPRSGDQLVAGDLAYVVCQRDHVRRTLGLFGHEEQEAGRIVIAGGGNIGYYVAQTIEELQPRTKIKIIESDRERAMHGVRPAAATRSCCTVRLSTSRFSSRPISRMPICMVALTNNDQINILGAAMAKRLGCKSSLALINNPSFQDITKSLGIDAYINPRAVTISGCCSMSARAASAPSMPSRRASAEVIEAEALETSPLVGVPLARPGIAARHPNRRGLSRRYGDPPGRRYQDQGRRPRRAVCDAAMPCAMWSRCSAFRSSISDGCLRVQASDSGMRRPVRLDLRL